MYAPQQCATVAQCYKQRVRELSPCAVLLQADLVANAELPIVDGGPVDALCGWFDVTFAGSTQQPADESVKLSTGPDATGAGSYQGGVWGATHSARVNDGPDA